MSKYVLIGGFVLLGFTLGLPRVADAQDNRSGEAVGDQGEQRNLGRMTTHDTPATGPAERFGEKGELAISSDAAFTLQRSSTSGVSGGTTTISIAPSADYFVGRAISIGGFLGFDYQKAGDNETFRFAIGPRVGYNIGLSDMVSLWPHAGVSLAATSAKTTTPTGSHTNSDTTLALNFFVPIMFHPATHFFVGFGPFLDADLSGDTRTTVFGGKLTVGGWVRP